MTRRILGAGVPPQPAWVSESGPLRKIISAEGSACLEEILRVIISMLSFGSACREEILESGPDEPGSVDWDLEDTLDKVRASEKDVITKEMRVEHEIIYSEDGKFPVLGVDGHAPAHLAWQHNPHHGLVINGEDHLIAAVKRVVVHSSPNKTTFDAANRSVQGKKEKTKLSQAKQWTAKTALFLIRLFATAIG